jgi:hypothetical protein
MICVSLSSEIENLKSLERFYHFSAAEDRRSERLLTASAALLQAVRSAAYRQLLPPFSFYSL